MIVNSTNKIIKCINNSTRLKFKINYSLINNNNNNSSSSTISNNNNKSFYNQRLFSTLNNNNNNNSNSSKKESDKDNNNNNKNKNENENENKDDDDDNTQLSKEEEEQLKEKVDQLVKEIESKQNQNPLDKHYTELTEQEKEEKRKKIYDEINKLEDEEEKPDPLEQSEENDEDDEDDDDDLDYPIGTEKTPLIFEDDKKNTTHKIVSDSLELIALEGKLDFMEGIRSIFSFFGFYSSYLPTRNVPLLNPFIHFCKNQCNYIFNKNPFFMIMVHRINSKLLVSELHNRIQDTPIPSFINKDEFLEESSKALKQIYKLAENEKSLELQRISCIPATPNLLALRDVYYSVGKVDGLEFNVDDISIDNFEFEPIDCKAYINDPNERYLKMESTYRVVSNRYNDQCNDYPIIARANWTTPFENKSEEEIDWKIFGIEFSTDYDPK